MAEGKKESRKNSLKSSMCQIKTQVPGNELATTGSAWVLKWPWEIEEFLSQSSQTATAAKSETTFLVTTGQVVTKSGLNSNVPWRAEFLPVKWLGTDSFSLNNVPVYETPSQRHGIELILIPAEALHKQKWMSWFRGNELQSVRFQVCHQRGSASELQAADPTQLLYCYVLTEKASSKEKFDLQCYLLSMDESGSFLQAHGSKAKLRKAEDFQPTERPKGSVILNESGNVVGLLAFDKEDEIIPLFFLQNLQDDNQASHVEINPKTSNGCSGSDGMKPNSSQGPGNNSDQDVNRNRQTEENQFPSCSINQSKQDNLEGSGHHEMQSKTRTGDTRVQLPPAVKGPDQVMEFERNEQVRGNQSQPSELSYVSQTLEGIGDDDHDMTEETQTRSRGDGQEERNPSRSKQSQDSGGTKVEEATFSAGYTISASQEPVARAPPPLPRCHSEQLTPRTQRKLQKSYSVMTLIPLKEGAMVRNVVMCNAYVIDTLSRLLDPTYTGLQNWMNLANLNDAPPELVLKCQSQERHSRSEEMFKVLAASDPDLLIGTLKLHFGNLQMNEAGSYIANLDDDMTIENFLETADPSLPGKVFMALDNQPVDKWQKLGLALGVGHQDLKGIKVDCANQHQNPAENVMEMICAKHPTMTIAQFKGHLKNIKRTDVMNKLQSWPKLLGR